MTLEISQGGTGGVTAMLARAKLGITALLDQKANSADMTTALAGKANASDVTNALALKADAATVTNLLAGKASVDGSGKILASALPAIAITDVFPVSSLSAMLGLAAERGDVAIRSDNNATYILSTEDPTKLANWLLLPVPASGIQSIAGLTGNTITASQLIAALQVPTLDSSGVLILQAPPKITTAHIDRSGICNPENAGADTTGTSDSNVAFQTCLDLLEAKGGTFLVPAGSCRITQDLQYQSAGVGFKMKGHGAASRIIQNGPDGGKLFDFRPNPGVFLYGMVLEDFYVECRNREGRAFEFVSNRGLYIKNVSGEPTTQDYYWGNVMRFIAVLESHMDGGNWKNALGGEGQSRSYVRGNLLNFMNTVLSFSSTNLFGLAFNCGSFSDSASSPGVEGVTFLNPTFVQVGRGFDHRNQGDQYGGVNSPYGAPANLRIHGGHIESFGECIRVRQGSCNIFQGMLLFRNLLYNEAGSHVFCGRQHNIQLTNLQLRTVGNANSSGLQAPSIIIVSGDYADITDVNGISVGATSGNNTCSSRFANFKNVKFNGPNLTGNGWDVTAADSQLDQVRLVTNY